MHIRHSFTRLRFCKYVNDITAVQISDQVILNSHQRQVVTQSLISHRCTKIVLDSCKYRKWPRSEQLFIKSNR